MVPNRPTHDICGEDDGFWRNIQQGLLPDDTWKKNFCMPKWDFEALVVELRPYILPNTSSPIHRSQIAGKKIAIFFKRSSLDMYVANSVGVAICSVVSYYRSM